MDDLISVVIPIYNVEKYLEKCIDSVIKQSYQNLEIILINDGSTDNSIYICKEYEKKDQRIKLVSKENGGLSDARNTGIEIATGKYITFIDSDDYISNDFIEYLLNKIKKYDADISICNPIYVYENNLKKVKKDNFNEKIYIYNSYKALEVMLYQKKFETSAWGKLYKTELFKDIRYPVGKIYEDIATTYKVILKSSKVVYSNKKKYYYLQNSTSIMGRPFKKNDLDYISNTYKLYEDVSKINTKLRNASISRYISTNFFILLKIPNDSNYFEILNDIEKNIIKYRLQVLFNFKVRLKSKIAILLSFYSFDLVRKIYVKIK